MRLKQLALYRTPALILPRTSLRTMPKSVVASLEPLLAAGATAVFLLQRYNGYGLAGCLSQARRLCS